jgi:hypothetical protein
LGRELPLAHGAGDRLTGNPLDGVRKAIDLLSRRVVGVTDRPMRAWLPLR